MFSIVIPLYNKEKQIAKTLESVFNQTYQEYEIIVVNDGSTDNSVDIVNQIDDKRIKLINQANGGVSSARNTGIKNACFEYIAFLDADDLWENDFLENIHLMIKNYPECSVFATNYKILDTQGEERFPVNTNLANFSKTFDNQCGVLQDYFDFASRTAPPICASSIVCKKISIKDIGCFPIGIKAGEDLLTWARLANSFKIGFSKKVCTIFNSDDNQNIRIPDKSDYVGDELEKLYLASKNKSITKYKLFWHKIRFTNFIRLGMKKEAKIEFEKIKNSIPFFKKFIFKIMFILPKSLILSIYNLNNLIKK